MEKYADKKTKNNYEQMYYSIKSRIQIEPLD